MQVIVYNPPMGAAGSASRVGPSAAAAASTHASQGRPGLQARPGPPNSLPAAPLQPQAAPGVLLEQQAVAQPVQPWELQQPAAEPRQPGLENGQQQLSSAGRPQLGSQGRPSPQEPTQRSSPSDRPHVTDTPDGWPSPARGTSQHAQQPPAQQQQTAGAALLPTLIPAGGCLSAVASVTLASTSLGLRSLA